jgi:hypothetical protein
MRDGLSGQPLGLGEPVNFGIQTVASRQQMPMEMVDAGSAAL